MNADGTPVQPSSSDVPVPKVIKLGWLIFMQPIKLHGMLKSWGIDPAGNAIKFWKQGNVGRQLVRRLLALLLLATPLITCALAILANHATAHGITAPAPGPWGTALDWLASIDERLRASQERLLIAVDEIERLEDEIRAGNTNKDFLDFVRAAGDRLVNIRIMMVSGLPLERLSDSARMRPIGAALERTSAAHGVDGRHSMGHRSIILGYGPIQRTLATAEPRREAVAKPLGARCCPG